MPSKKYTKEDCIESLQEASEQFDKSLSRRDYTSTDFGPAASTIMEKFDGWNKAKRAAGLTTNEKSVAKFSEGIPDILDISKSEWQDLHPEQRRKYRRRAWVAEMKVERGCSECGYDDNPAALSFHHINPDEKIMKISMMAGDGYSRETIIDEIEKCKVMCQNCHSILENSGIYK